MNDSRRPLWLINKFTMLAMALIIVFSGLGITAAPVAQAAEPEEATYLSDLNWVSAVSGWKTVQRDKNVDGKPILMNGTTYTKGLGLHANSEIVYQLDGQYSTFRSIIGPDDKHINNSARATSVIFSVYGDGVKLFDSGVMRMYPESQPTPISVGIAGVHELRLVVDGAGDPTSNPIHSDWANWAEARVVRTIDPSTMLSGITLDNVGLADFAKEKKWYEVGLAEDAPIPVVKAASLDENAAITVSQAQSLPGAATISVTNNSLTTTYTIQFKLKDVVFLSDLNWTAASSGWQTVQKDKSVGGTAINLLGHSYAKGLGTHANSVIKYELNGKYTKFKSDIGFDHSRTGKEPFASVNFTVKADGVTRFNSGVLSSDHPVESSVDISVEGVNLLELVVLDADDGNSNDWANWANARLITGEPTGTLLNQIKADGVPLADFSKGQLEYMLVLPAGSTVVPQLTVEKENAEATVQIEQAASIPGTTVIKVTKGANVTEYKIHFSLKDPGLDVVELSADKLDINPLLTPTEVIQTHVRAFNGDGTEVDFDDPNVKVNYSIVSLYKSSKFEVATIDDNGVVHPVKDNDNHWVGGSARVKVTVISGGRTKEDEMTVVVRPFYIDYSKTLVMKYFLARNGNVELNLEEALEATKKIDILTRGIPKVVYLVGWQFEGHDSKYPSWDQVNVKLKRPQDETAEQSLIWLMEEAKKYNTTISLHLNMTTAFPDSPLWDEYVAADLIGKVKGSAGTYNGVEVKEGDYSVYGGSYAITYYRDWRSGLLQQRIQRLLEMLPPLKDGATIHTDAFHLQVPQSANPTGRALNLSEWHQQLEGYTNADEVETMRNIFQYWRDQGLDLTSEFVDSYRQGEAFVGLQPMAWHFRGVVAQKNWLMNVPANLYVGGRGGDLRYGSSMLGEGRVKRNNLQNMNGFLEDFALNTLPWYYLNRLDRISDDGVVAHFSNDVTSFYNGDKLTIKQGDKVLQSGGDLFVPSLWTNNEKEIMAYSLNGYSNVTWSFPDQWENVHAVDTYKITADGLVPDQSNVPITSGTITLTLAANTGLTIVPSGTNLNEVSGVVINKEHLRLTTGQEGNLVATVQPEQATNKGVVWTSGDPTIASIDQNGKVTGLSNGTTVITVQTQDGKYSRSSIIQVAPEKVQLVKTDLPSKVYSGARSISLSTDTPGASIYYTIGGSEPSEDSTLYTEPIVLPLGVTVIRMIAIKDGMSSSDVTANAYTILEADIEYLNSLIATAQELHHISVEGDQIGQYPVGAKTAFQAAIDAAKAAGSNAEISTEQIKQTAAQLESAILTFKQSIIKEQPNPGVADLWSVNRLVTASEIRSDRITLTWSGMKEGAAATGFKVTWGSNEKAVDGDKLSTTITGLTESTSYAFKVEARDTEGLWTVNGPSVSASTGKVPTNPEPSPSPSPTPSTGTGNVTNPPVETIRQVEASELNPKDGKVALALTTNQTIVSLPAAAGQLDGNVLELSRTDVVMSIPPSVLKALAEKAGAAAQSTLRVKLEPVSVSASAAKAGESSHLKLGDHIYEFDLYLLTGNQQVRLTEFPEPVQLTLHYDPSLVDSELVGVYHFDETSHEWEYIGGQIDKNNRQIEVKLNHFSQYALLEMNKRFNDVPESHWSYRALQVLTAKHIVKGKSDDQFSPDSDITRAEFTSLLARALGLSTNLEPDAFVDVAADAWYAKEVNAAYEAGIVTGMSATEFKPDGRLTREQMAALLVRAYEYKSGQSIEFGAELQRFADADQLSEWAKDEASKAVAAGLMQGKSENLFDAGSKAQRAETVQAIYNWLNAL
ncbi:NPCBM/NEW2 domain-containing protein [Paenibacillus sp. FJAT-27812]|uniref:NPCBM/NEW2 domain-containing protein n=1 Tax=Paenibacillus sp. FJAT-27812 TaxID=1684143 RepID=UPI0006A7669C|nr:NPCBM/NEW2 domain-containing protein [Paenibacillus sp. FJAT-27812]